jgi:hypothetical protein
MTKSDGLKVTKVDLTVEQCLKLVSDLLKTVAPGARGGVAAIKGYKAEKGWSAKVVQRRTARKEAKH